MSKSKQRKNEAHPADGREPKADSRVSDNCSLNDPIYQSPNRNEPLASSGKPKADSPVSDSPRPVQASFTGPKPKADSPKPTADSRSSDSRQPTADSCLSDSQQPTADSRVSDSRQPTADSCLSDSREPTADSHFPDSRQPTADSRVSDSRFPDSRQPLAESCSSDEINLLDYLRVIYKYRWMIMILTILTMAATVVYSLCQPRMYQANTSIVPPIDMLSKGSGLSGKLGGASSVLLQGMLNEGDLSGLYVGILESRTVSEALIDRFDLINVYGKKKDITRTDARKILKGNTTTKASKEGIVHITVKDLDPKRVATLANAYVEELDIQIKQLSGGQATSKRVFLETRLKEIQGELSKIESLQSREVQIKEMLFELLNRECEIAKIEEAKSMPTIQVLDTAIAPEIGMGRGTAKKGILAGIATMMLGVFIAFGREYVQGIKATA